MMSFFQLEGMNQQGHFLSLLQQLCTVALLALGNKKMRGRNLYPSSQGCAFCFYFLTWLWCLNNVVNRLTKTGLYLTCNGVKLWPHDVISKPRIRCVRSVNFA